MLNMQSIGLYNGKHKHTSVTQCKQIKRQKQAALLSDSSYIFIPNRYGKFCKKEEEKQNRKKINKKKADPFFERFTVGR